MLQILNTLFETGVFDQLYKAGLISSKLSTYRDIYLYVDAQMKTRGLCKEQAVVAASVQFDVDRRTIYRALAALKMPLILARVA